MKGGLTVLLIFAAWLLPVSTPALAMPPGEWGQKVRRAAQLIGELRLEEAARLEDEVERHYPDDADLLEVTSLIHFHEGRYSQAVDAMDRAVVAAATDERRRMVELMRSTKTATAGMVEVRSSDGRFIVQTAPGIDEILAPYAIEAMRAADTRLGEILGVRVPGPIRLEIYPSSATLAAVSSLTVEEIERTGTIALCKWDRLMVTSPRALLRGYPWMDTIAHEYVHLVLARASRDRAPVWFQEGTAKYLERTWRGERPASHVEPAVDAILRRRYAENALLPFDALHPSIARLDSQEDAALAFAQVATFIETFHQTHGDDGLRAVVTRIAGGQDTRDALAEVGGASFDDLEAHWLAAVGRRRGPDADDGPRMLGMRFRHGDGDPDEAREVQEAARRAFRLGDLLWAHDRPRAASVEYEKAHHAAPDDPIVASRLARAALSGGRAGVAVSTLMPLRERYPDHAPLRSLLGTALLAQGDIPRARAELVEALRLNPFDPEPHCGLAAASTDAADRRRLADVCRRLGGRLAPRE
jgi:Flp pilus assembly protein TadD